MNRNPDEIRNFLEATGELIEDLGTRLQKREQQVQIVRAAIIGALAGGHIDERDGAGYSKTVLHQIADLLDIELPESVR